MLTIWQAIILGIIQGITEFFPVSSTAHLILVPWIFHWPSDGGLTFDVALHAGTLAAVIGFFFMTWIRIIRAGFGAAIDVHTGAAISGRELETQRRLLWFLVLATIPGGVIGLLFDKQIETTWRNPLIIAASLIAVAIVMGWADRAPAQTTAARRSDSGAAPPRLPLLPPRGASASGTPGVGPPSSPTPDEGRSGSGAGHCSPTTGRDLIGNPAPRPAFSLRPQATRTLPRKDFEQTSAWEAWWIGCAQAVAVIPGVSRSGATITAGLFAGMTREAAARFSFLLATPIIAGAVLDKAHEVHKTGIPAGMHGPFIAGIIASAIVGVASIGLFIRFLKVRTLTFFVWYRIALGLVVLGLFFAGFRQF